TTTPRPPARGISPTCDERWVARSTNPRRGAKRTSRSVAHAEAAKARIVAASRAEVLPVGKHNKVHQARALGSWSEAQAPAERGQDQKTRLTLERMSRLVARYLPLARITHPYPSARFRLSTQGKSWVH